MKSDKNLCLDVRLVPNFQTAINQWLAARGKFKMEPSDRNQNEYNAAYYDLGTAFGERYPEGANTTDAFEWFRRSLIAPEEE